MEQQFPSCLSGSFFLITYCNPPTGSLLLSDMPLGPITWAYVFLHPTSLIEGMPLWNCLILFNCRENTAVCKSIQEILVLLILRMDVLTDVLCVFFNVFFLTHFYATLTSLLADKPDSVTCLYSKTEIYGYIIKS